MDFKAAKKDIQAATLERDVAKAARLWKALYEHDPAFTLIAGRQYDLCKVLLLGHNVREAIEAYENLLTRYPDAPVALPARLEYAGLCIDFPDRHSQALRYLREYLAQGPIGGQRDEAQMILGKLQPPTNEIPPREGPPPDLGAPENVPPPFAPPGGGLEPAAPPPSLPTGGGAGPGAPYGGSGDPFAAGHVGPARQGHGYAYGGPSAPGRSAGYGGSATPSSATGFESKSSVSLPHVSISDTSAPPGKGFPSASEFLPKVQPSWAKPQKEGGEAMREPGSRMAPSTPSLPGGSMVPPPGGGGEMPQTESAPAAGGGPMDDFLPPPTTPPPSFETPVVSRPTASPPAGMSWGTPPSAPQPAYAPTPPPKYASMSPSPGMPTDAHGFAPPSGGYAPPEAEPPSPYSDQVDALLNIQTPPALPPAYAPTPAPKPAPPPSTPLPSDDELQPPSIEGLSFEMERPATEEIEDRTRTLEEQKFRKEQEDRQKKQEYEAVLQRSRFSALLPVGKRIHFEATCRLVANYLDIDPSSAKQKLRRGKGIVLRDLSYDDMVEFYHTLLDSPQKIVFVRQPEELDSARVQPMLSAQPFERNVRVATERGFFRVEWEHVQLVSAGWIKSPKTSEEPYLIADFFVESPVRHLRLYDSTFSYRTWFGGEMPPPESRFRLLVLDWSKQSPNAEIGHTIRLLERGESEDFQVFSSSLEFDNYNRWLLLSHFGDHIDPARKRSKAATNFS